MMTLNEMKLAVASKLRKLVVYSSSSGLFYWRKDPDKICRPIHWPTEGLQVCHEAEKLLMDRTIYLYATWVVVGRDKKLNEVISATYEQRLEALCQVWWPERFE